MPFLNSVFRRLIGRFNVTEHNRHSERVFVGAFGKHPGWDDHIDDIGLDTDVLIAAKRKLYVRGISRNVDSGRWDQLANDCLAEGFNREIFWNMNGRLIAGRMWPSRDGKGRTSYPLVVCVEGRKLPTQWVLRAVLPQLEKIQKTCTATDSADEVRLTIQKARQELRQLAQQCENSRDSVAASPDALARLSERKEFGPGLQGLFRVLYHIDREVGRLRHGASKSKASGSTLLRLPTNPDTVLEDVFLWTNFLLAEFETCTSILALVPPLANKWIDLIVGEPTEAHLYCLQAPTKVIPLTSNIPYNISPEFVKHAGRLIGGGHIHTPGSL